MVFKKLIFYISLFSLLISACTIQKRTYRSGYYVHWNSTKPAVSQKEKLVDKKNKNENSKTLSHPDSSLLYASSDNAVLFIEPRVKQSSFPFDNDCGDSIILKSGTASRVQIIEVTDVEVHYKRCANLNGPVIAVHKNDVARIRYSNGNSETFENIKKNDLKKIIKGEKKFAPDTTASISLFFAFLFLLCWILMLLGILVGVELLFLVGFILATIFFFISLITSVYSLYKIITDPENNTGKSKAKMALFIIFLGAFLAAVPLILIYLGLLVV